MQKNCKWMSLSLQRGLIVATGVCEDAIVTTTSNANKEVSWTFSLTDEEIAAAMKIVRESTHAESDLTWKRIE
jgi:hypothetical protein